MVSYGLNIVQYTGNFERNLMEWYEKEDSQRTWSNFNQHFSAVHRALKQVRRGTVIKNTPFRQAHHLMEEMSNSIADQQNEFRESMSLILHHICKINTLHQHLPTTNSIHKLNNK